VRAWLIVVCFDRFLLGLLNTLPGHQREFSLTDITIQYPFKREHVPPWLLFTISLATPLFFVAIIGGFVYRNRWDVHNAMLGGLTRVRSSCCAAECLVLSLLGVFMGFTVTGVVTQVIKVCAQIVVVISRCPVAEEAPPPNTDDSRSSTSGHAQPLPPRSGCTRPSSVWSLECSGNLHLNRHAHPK
jgi:hypothetical protein